jgi:DNA-directed RNA polymerase specialized sigma24 family protein
VHVCFDDVSVAAAQDDTLVLQVNDALEKFAVEEPEKAELVKLRYFVGLTLEETAQALDIAEPTARRWWVYARAWLLKEMHSAGR